MLDDVNLEIQFRGILERRCEPMRSVRWIQPMTRDGAIYEVRFTDDVTLELSFDSPSGAPDNAKAVFLKRGQTLIHFHAEEGEHDFDLIAALYRKANRSYLKADKVVSDLMEQLNQGGAIGIEPPEPPEPIF